MTELVSVTSPKGRLMHTEEECQQATTLEDGNGTQDNHTFLTPHGRLLSYCVYVFVPALCPNGFVRQFSLGWMSWKNARTKTRLFVVVV